jgi:transcriptional regulator with XRE-family HTH domain
MSNIKRVFAANLRKLRHSKNLNQEDVAELLGVTLGSYTSYELQKSLPKPDKLKALAEIFNVDVSDLYADADAPKYTLSEKAPLGELIELIQRKTAGIPDDVITLAMNFSKDDKDVWDVVRGALEHGIKGKDKKKPKSKKA